MSRVYRDLKDIPISLRLDENLYDNLMLLKEYHGINSTSKMIRKLIELETNRVFE